MSDKNPFLKKALLSTRNYFFASVWSAVFLPVFLSSGFTAVLVAIDKNWYRIGKLELPFIAALMSVTAFLMVFRTKTGYDRYTHGRLQWATIVTTCKSFGRLVWVGMNPTEKHNENERLINEALQNETYDESMDRVVTSSQVRADREELLKLLLVFCFSVLRFLRREQDKTSIDPYYFAQDPRRVKQDSAAGEVPSPSAKDNETSASTLRSIDLNGVHVPRNPTTVLHQIMLLVNIHVEEGSLDLRRGMMISSKHIPALLQAFQNCRQVLETPIPRAYRLHMVHMLTILSMIFPIGFVDEFGFLMIPITAIVTFVYWGVYKIGSSIERPFGTSWNDLPMERFIRELELELFDITSRTTGDENLMATLETTMKKAKLRRHHQTTTKSALISTNELSLTGRDMI